MKLTMQLPTSPLPFGTTFALTMSAMLLMASFELAHGGLFGCTRGDKSVVCGKECRNCGQFEHPTDSTILIAHLDESKFRFATAIGKRLALSNRASEWMGHDTLDYLVYLRSAPNTISVKDKKGYCRLKAVMFKNEDDKHDIVLVHTDKDLPIFACLPTCTFTENVIEAFFYIPVHVNTKGQTILLNESLQLADFTETLASKELTVIGEEANNKRQLTLNTFIPESADQKIAEGAAVMRTEDGRHTVFGIVYHDKNADQSHYHFERVDFTDILAWIHTEAEKYCVCAPPQALARRASNTH